MGSVKNVGIAAVDAIVAERKKNGNYKSFTDFCERISSEAVNKKCIESLIKSGAFDSFEQTRSTLLASFEQILDTIQDTSRKAYKGQVSMFDLGSEEDEIQELKYTFTTLKEFSEKEMLSMEKEMLGLYISGHPLESLRNEIATQSTINTLKMREIMENFDNPEVNLDYRDGQNVKYIGVISSVKKKYTKSNKLMAFITIEDLFGSAEIIAFENAYQSASNILVNENIVIVEGRLSIREDEEVKIVAKEIKEFSAKKGKVLSINITNIDEEMKKKLRGALKFFSGEKNNMIVQVVDNGEIKPCGSIYLTPDILTQFEELMGKERVGFSE